MPSVSALPPSVHRRCCTPPPFPYLPSHPGGRRDHPTVQRRLRGAAARGVRRLAGGAAPGSAGRHPDWWVAGKPAGRGGCSVQAAPVEESSGWRRSLEPPVQAACCKAPPIPPRPRSHAPPLPSPAGDQLFRNAFRGTAKMYAADEKALAWAKGLLVRRRRTLGRQRDGQRATCWAPHRFAPNRAAANPSCCAACRGLCRAAGRSGSSSPSSG